jgi:hypothetical protein
MALSPFAADNRTPSLETDVGRSRQRKAQEPKPNGEAGGEAITIDSRAPYATAKLFLERNFVGTGGRTLHHHRSAFYRWAGTAYAEAPNEALRARLYEFLNGCTGSGKKPRPVKPNASMVGNVLDGLRAATHLDGTTEPPARLDPVADLAATDIIACANGLLHLPTLTLLPATPRFFTLNALDFGFERLASAPAGSLEFLAQLWGDDAEAIDTLQEIAGYCLTADTNQQKHSCSSARSAHANAPSAACCAP